MKNIHILPTDEPSRLVKIYNDINKENFTLKLDVEVNDSFKEYVNIYITSPDDEWITEGDWYIDDYKMVRKSFISDIEYWSTKWSAKQDFKKVILTTDQDLIKDGVQAIDDEFLEWFVKNPSCEEVVVGYGVIRLTETDNKGYWVAIPNAEFNMQEKKPKQETIEEVAVNYANYNEQIQTLYKEFEQALEMEKQERMYSEEDVLNFAQIIISQYKFGNTNIEQIDLLKETLNAFREALDAARNFKKK